MAKRRPKTLWVKLDGTWFKAPVTYGKVRKWTHGLKDLSGGWEKRGGCDMTERHHIHNATVRGPLLKEAI